MGRLQNKLDLVHSWQPKYKLFGNPNQTIFHWQKFKNSVIIFYRLSDTLSVNKMYTKTQDVYENSDLAMADGTGFQVQKYKERSEIFL